MHGYVSTYMFPSSVHEVKLRFVNADAFSYLSLITSNIRAASSFPAEDNATVTSAGHLSLYGSYPSHWRPLNAVLISNTNFMETG